MKIHGPKIILNNSLLFWGIAGLIYWVVIARLLTHPASLTMVADTDAHWYLSTAEGLAAGVWGQGGQMPFMPLYAIMLLPAYWFGYPENAALIAFSLIWVGFIWAILKLEGPNWVMLLPFTSIAILNLYLLAWSEVLSLPLLVLFLIALKHRQRYPAVAAWLLALLLLTRWANLYFCLPFLALLMLQTAGQQGSKPALIVKRLLPVLGALIMVIALNILQTGHVFGFSRIGDMGFAATDQSGLVNEVINPTASAGINWIISMYHLAIWYANPAGYWMRLLLGIGIQIGLMVYLWRLQYIGWLGRWSYTMLIIAIGYCGWLAMAERLTELDAIDSRLLSPVLIVVWMSIVKLDVKSGPENVTPT